MSEHEKKAAPGKGKKGAAAAKTRLYAVGDRNTGVVFITLEPLRVSFVPKSEIAYFAGKNRRTEASVFRDIVRAIKFLILENEGAVAPIDAGTQASIVADQVVNGSKTCEAEFCFVADLGNNEWEENRIPFPPLFDAVDYLAGRPYGEPPDACKDTANATHDAWLVNPGDQGQCRQ